MSTQFGFILGFVFSLTLDSAQAANSYSFKFTANGLSQEAILTEERAGAFSHETVLAQLGFKGGLAAEIQVHRRVTGWCQVQESFEMPLSTQFSSDPTSAEVTLIFYTCLFDHEGLDQVKPLGADFKTPLESGTFEFVPVP